MRPERDNAPFSSELSRRVASAPEIWIADGPSERLSALLGKRAVKPLVIFVGRLENHEPLPGDFVLSLRQSLARMRPSEIFRTFLDAFKDFPEKPILSVDSALGEGLISRYGHLLGARAKILPRRPGSRRIPSLTSSDECDGRVESIRHEDGALVISGWCMNKNTYRPVRELFFFHGDREIRVHLSPAPRSLEMAGLGLGFGESGFVAYCFSPRIKTGIREISVVGVDGKGKRFSLKHDFARHSKKVISIAGESGGLLGDIKVCVSDPEGSGNAWIWGWVLSRTAKIRSMRLRIGRRDFRQTRLFDPFLPMSQAIQPMNEREMARPFAAIMKVPASARKIAPRLEAALGNGKHERGRFRPVRVSAKYSLAHPSSVRAAKAAIRASEKDLERFLRQGEVIRFERSRKTPELSIVILLHNKAAVSYRALRSLEKYTPKNCEIVLVDNASKDRTPELLNRIHGARILRNTRNLHFIRGANEGARLSRGRYLLFLNNDCEVLPDTISAALARARSSPRIGIVGGKLLHPDQTLQESGFGLRADGMGFHYGYGEDPERSEYSFVRRIVACTGAFLLTRRELFRKLGGFNKRYLPAYFEDLDYCLRVNRSGYDVVYEPRAALTHLGSTSRRSDFEHIHSVYRSQGKFRGHWAKELAKRPDYCWTHTLKTRRVLVITQELFPRSACALLDVLRKIDDRDTQVTVFPLNSEHRGAPDWSEIRRVYPDSVEVIRDGSAGSLETFLCERCPGFGETHFGNRSQGFLDWIDPSLRPRAGKPIPHRASW